MKKIYIYDKNGLNYLRSEEAIPKCGIDFCDKCGDCLYCFGDESCIEGGSHFWVQYGENKE